MPLSVPLACLVAPRFASRLVQMPACSMPLCPGPLVLTSTQRACLWPESPRRQVLRREGARRQQEGQEVAAKPEDTLLGDPLRRLRCGGRIWKPGR